MPELNPLRHLARHTPAPFNALLDMGASTLSDIVELRNGLPGGDDLDAWDPEYIERTLPLMRFGFNTYFRGEVRGLENIPAEGPALLVGNHSGGIYIADTFVFTMEFYDHFGPNRRFHQLAHNLAARFPTGGLIRRYGTVVASHDNARAAFARGAPVLVYPGGDYETFRPSSHRDRIEFGDRKGFIKLALAENVPIIPVVSAGGQETAWFVSRGERAAKLLRLDQLARLKVLPVSIGPPFGVNLLDFPGRLPLPAKITIKVLPRIDVRSEYGPKADVDRVYDHVTGRMQDALDDLADERALPVLG